MKRSLYTTFTIFTLLAFSSCLENPDMTVGIVNGKEKPTVKTRMDIPSLQINYDGNLFFYGEIASEGKAEIIKKGFYWSTVNRDPGSEDSIVTVLNSSFEYVLKNVSGDTTYYWRAFAENDYGYDYGVVNSYKTPVIWEEKDSLIANSRGRGAVFTVNNNIYITCGELSGSGRVQVKETFEYSITDGNWNYDYYKSFPGDYRTNPVVFTIGNYAYVGTGRKTAEEAHNDFYMYNNFSDTKWMKIETPADLEARYGASAFSINGKGYLVGGYSYQDGLLNDVWQYNPDTGNWERKNNFSFKLFEGISISDNHRGFIGFGNDESTSRTLWEYDSVTDSWSEFARLPDEIRTKIYSGVIVHNTIYIVDDENKIWTLNMSDKTWKHKANLPSKFLNEHGEGGFQMLLNSTNSNSIYVGLGFTKSLYEYHPLWDN